MDNSQREQLQTAKDFMQSPQLARGVLWLYLSVPTILLVAAIAIWSEIGAVQDAWPWRNAVETVATVKRHTTIGDGYRFYRHEIDYHYIGNNLPFTKTLHLGSPSDRVVYIEEEAFKFAEDSKFKVYYLPDRPLNPRVLIDPRITLRDGLWRLGIVAGFFVLLGIATATVALTYRPRRRVAADTQFKLPPNAVFDANFDGQNSLR